MTRHPNRALAAWLAIGFASYLIFPWYAIQDTAWYYVLPQILGGSETANGLLQTFDHVSLIVGVVVAFLAAVLSIKWMVRYLSRHGLAIFGYYRVLIAAATTILLATQLI